MYDPTIGRWTSQDPIGFEAGDANLYRYVGNGPTNAVDPTGLKGAGPAYGACNAVHGMVDGLHWAREKKSRIEYFLFQLIVAAQFKWPHWTGTFGSCDKWVAEYFKRVQPLMTEISQEKLPINVKKVDWSSIGLAGHTAVQIRVEDDFQYLHAHPEATDGTFTIYLDDGNVGEADHVFVDAEIPWYYTPVNNNWPNWNYSPAADGKPLTAVEAGVESAPPPPRDPSDPIYNPMTWSIFPL
jgi:uncharacterized protein RhaS with RHS repeats